MPTVESASAAAYAPGPGGYPGGPGQGLGFDVSILHIYNSQEH